MIKKSFIINLYDKDNKKFHKTKFFILKNDIYNNVLIINILIITKIVRILLTNIGIYTYLLKSD